MLTAYASSGFDRLLMATLALCFLVDAIIGVNILRTIFLNKNQEQTCEGLIE